MRRLLVLCSAVMFSCSAMAADHKKDRSHHHKPGKFLKLADKDGDGKISQTEFMSAKAAKAKKRFAAWDSDANGSISEAEFIAAYKHKKAGKFKRIDKNNDGFISKKELAKAHHKMKGKHHKGHHD